MIRAASVLTLVLALAIGTANKLSANRLSASVVLSGASARSV